MDVKTSKSSSSGKYIKYAIGEIILVVIGILIALQISNWNEDRKEQKFEQEILFLIDENLERDFEHLSEEAYLTSESIRYTDKLVAQVENKKGLDSLNIWMGHIICFERFKSQSSAFEVLKSKGIGNISDKQLQLAFISYYDESLYGLYQSIEDVIHSFKVDWIPIVKSEFTDFKFREYCIPTNPKVFFGKSSSIVMFKIFKDNRAGQLGRMISSLAKIKELRVLIKEELK